MPIKGKIDSAGIGSIGPKIGNIDKKNRKIPKANGKAYRMICIVFLYDLLIDMIHQVN